MARYLTLLSVLLLAIAGCTSQQMVDEQLALCPDYFRENLGQARILPFWSAVVPLTGGPFGWLNKTDGSYSLTALAGKDVVLHEAFHSFDYLCMTKRPDEWQVFVDQFTLGKGKKPNLPVYFISMAIPFVSDIPVPRHVRFYGMATGAEDAVDCFVFGIRGRKRDDPELMRKCGVVGRFARGEYAKYNEPMARKMLGGFGANIRSSENGNGVSGR